MTLLEAAKAMLENSEFQKEDDSPNYYMIGEDEMEALRAAIEAEELKMEEEPFWWYQISPSGRLSSAQNKDTLNDRWEKFPLYRRKP